MHKEEIIIRENFLSHEECDWFINLHKQFEGSITESVNLGANNVNIEVLHLENLISLEYDSLVEKLNNNCPLDDFSVNYAHVVHWPTNSALGAHFDQYDTKFTSIIYLNDDYSGGITYIGKTKITPKKGSIVSFWGAELLHGVEEVKGNRYTIPVWYSTQDLIKKRLGEVMKEN